MRRWSVPFLLAFLFSVPLTASAQAPASAPASFAGTALTSTTVSWTWNPVSGATGYKFYPSTGGAAFALPATSYLQAGLAANTTYGARVSATNAGGEGPLTANTTTLTLLPPPTGFA